MSARPAACELLALAADRDPERDDAAVLDLRRKLTDINPVELFVGGADADHAALVSPDEEVFASRPVLARCLVR